MKRLFLICAVGVAVALLFFWLQVGEKTLPVRMQESERFQVKEVYQDTDTLYRALYSYDDEFVRLELYREIENKNAEDYIKTQTARMQGLYANARSPYPGDVSDEIVCAEEFKPQFEMKTREGIEFSSFLGYVNDRFAYGSCTENQAVYRSSMSLYYCPGEKTLYQVEILVPKEKHQNSFSKYKDIEKSLACR